MKRIWTLLLLIATFLLSLPIYAEETGPTEWNNDLGCFDPLRDYVGGHSHEYLTPNRNPELVVGADVIYRIAEKGKEGENETVWEWLIPDWVKTGVGFDMNNTTDDDKWKFDCRAVYFINE